jgi:hypothetical protein
MRARLLLTVLICLAAPCVVAGNVDEAEVKEVKNYISKLIKVLSEKKEKDNIDQLVPKKMREEDGFEKKKLRFLEVIDKRRNGLLKCLKHAADQEPFWCLVNKNRTTGSASFKLGKKEFGQDKIDFYFTEGRWFIK